MAVIDIYTDTNVNAGKLGNPARSYGTKVLRTVHQVIVGATDTAASIYRLIKGLDVTSIITGISYYNDALNGSATIDFGLYQPGIGGSKTINTSDRSQIFDATLAVVSAHTTLQNGLTALTTSNRFQTIGELLSLTPATFVGPYDLAMTLHVAGANGGNLIVIVDYIQG